MNAPTRKVLLLQEGDAPHAALLALEAALQTQCAMVRREPLQAPYDTLLDALADGWIPVLMPPREPMPDL